MAAEIVPFDQGQDNAPRLPHNIEAEAALLGAMMIENKLIDRVADILLPAHFFEPLHARIFSAILAHHGRGQIVTPVSIKPYFDADEGMKEVGGVGYLAGLTGSGAAVIGAMDFARQVFDLAQLRALIGSLQKALEKAHDTSEEISADLIAADLEQALADATTKSDDGAAELSLAECVAKAREEMENDDIGITCGIEPIDEALGPIRRKNMVILAGRPGMFKTGTAISYGLGAARKGHGVLFVTVDMSGVEIGERAICDISFDSRSCQLLYDHVTGGTLDEAERIQFARAELEARELPFQVIDAGNYPVNRVARAVRRWKRRFAARGQSLDLVIVDYLQKLRGAGTNRFEIVTEISQTLKEIAKDNDVGVMALAQLSRKVEEREDKRPQMSDLRESGQVEQDAEAILFLFRQEYYLERALPPEWADDYPTAMEALRACHGDIEFICGKRRKGKVRTTRGRFYGAYQAVRGVHD